MYSHLELSDNKAGQTWIRGDLYGFRFSLHWDETQWRIGTVASPDLTLESFKNYNLYLTEYVKLASMGHEEAQIYLRCQ